MNDVWIVGGFCSAGAVIGYFISPIKVARLRGGEVAYEVEKT